MSSLKDILSEVETLLMDDKEKRKSITDAVKQLDGKVVASMQVSIRRHNRSKNGDKTN